jgi:hypothetical protein
MRLGASLDDVRRHVGIDPFGNLPYATTDVYNHSVVMVQLGYDNTMRRKVRGPTPEKRPRSSSMTKGGTRTRLATVL